MHNIILKSVVRFDIQYSLDLYVKVRVIVMKTTENKSENCIDYFFECDDEKLSVHQHKPLESTRIALTEVIENRKYSNNQITFDCYNFKRYTYLVY